MAIPAEAALRAFILDYLNKRGFTSAAEGLRVDHLQKGEQDISYPPVDLLNTSFLYEWFGVFWDVYSARLNPVLIKNRWHQQQQLQQASQQQHHQRQLHQQQQHPHPQQLQHLQQSHQHPGAPPPSQQPQHPQHPSQTPDPTVGAQPGQVPNPAHPLAAVGVDGSVPPGASPSIPGQGPLGSTSIGQNPQNLFAAHTSVNQARARAQQHTSQSMLNHPAFRNAPSSMQNAPAQLHSQQLQSQQFRRHQQQQALLQSAQRPQQSASATARLRNPSVDSRRALSQSQLHSLSLDPALQGQKNPLAPDQSAAAAAAMSGDILDVSGALDGIFSSVGTRTAPSRGNGAAAAAAGRGMMPQIPGRVQTSQAATGSSSHPLRANGSNGRSFAGLQIPGSEAPSSASRRGSMDISGNVHRAYEDVAVEDESQPRTGPNGTSSTTKKRSASQGLSRKSAGAGAPDGIASPRAPLVSVPEGGGPAKRQRSSGAYQRNVAASPAIQRLELEQLSRGLQQNAAQGQSVARSRAQVLAMQQQRQQQQAYGQGADRMSSAQFLSQLGATDNAMSRSGSRYTSRASTMANPPSFSPNDQAQNRQRDAFLQNQLSGARRTPVNSANEAAKVVDGRTTSRTPKASDAKVTMPQGSQAGIPLQVSGLPQGITVHMLDGLTYVLNNDRKIPVQQVLGVPANASSLGLGNAGPPTKKVGQSGQPEGNPMKSEGHDQQSAVGSEAQQGDAQMSDQLGRKDDGGSLRMRQSYGRGDLLKPTGTIHISEQEMTLSSKKSKADTNASANSKQNGSRGDLKRNTSSRAMKTIETTGVSRGRATPDSANKGSALSGPSVTLPQVGLAGSIVTSGAKRDRGAAEGELENRSTKSDRPTSGNRGGGTPSQKSTASGGSTAVEGRAQGASTSGTRRGRGRSRGRGAGSSRRGRGDRGGPPRGGNGSRGGTGTQAPRTTALEQKTAVSSGLQRTADAARAPQAESDRIMVGSSMLIPPRANSSNHESRAQNQKAENGGRGSAKHEETDLQRSTKLPFDLDGDNTNNETRVQDQNADRPPGGSHLHNGGQAQLLEMLQQSSTGTAGRTNGDVELDQVDKAFAMQQLSLIASGAAGKMGNQSGNNFSYEVPQFMTGGVDDADIGNMLNSMQETIGLEPPTDFEADNILGVDDPADLTITARNRP